MTSPRQTIAKLRRLAQGQGNEADVARTALHELEAKYPTEAALAEADAEAVRTDQFQVGTDWHQQELFIAVGFYLGVQTFSYKPSKGPQSLMFAMGPAGLLDLLPKMVATLREKVNELHRGTTLGFIAGALPFATPPPQPEEEANSKDVLSPDALIAARAAMGVGSRSQPRRQLMEKKEG